MKILLNELLKLDDLSKVKIRLNLSNGNYNAMENYHNNKESLLIGNFYNSTHRKWFKEGEIVIGLAQFDKGKWLLFDISRITKAHDRLAFDNAGLHDFYDFETLTEYEKYFGRLVVKFDKDNAYVIVRGDKIDRFEVYEILPSEYEELDIFPGYDNIDLSWTELGRVLKKESWQTALKNQKGVYLITDTLTNKRYVGSAYGNDMILGRWKAYAENGHGGNKELVELAKSMGDNWKDYIRQNFRYTILDIYKSVVDDSTIIQRESRWKRVLLSRQFGYNAN